jgi:hypothetical protein
VQEGAKIGQQDEATCGADDDAQLRTVDYFDSVTNLCARGVREVCDDGIVITSSLPHHIITSRK